MTTLGPFDRAYIESNNVIIPCSGPVQAMGCLMVATAAPELLAALERAANYLHSLPSHLGLVEYDAAQVAIRKAKGA